MLAVAKRDAVAAYGDNRFLVSTAEIRLLQRLQQRLDLRRFGVFIKESAKQSFHARLAASFRRSPLRR